MAANFENIVNDAGRGRNWALAHPGIEEAVRRAGVDWANTELGHTELVGPGYMLREAAARYAQGILRRLHDDKPLLSKPTPTQREHGLTDEHINGLTRHVLGAVAASAARQARDAVNVLAQIDPSQLDDVSAAARRTITDGPSALADLVSS